MYTIDHVGYLVKDINLAIEEFLKLGFSLMSDITDDIERNCKICFMKQGDYSIELVSPNEDNSYVMKMYEKYGNSPYHICYQVEDIKAAIEKFKSMGYTQMRKTETAPALDNQLVVFLYNRNIGIVELVGNSDTKQVLRIGAIDG